MSYLPGDPTLSFPGFNRAQANIDFSNLSLAGGTSDQTIYTPAASRHARITSVVARYVGTTLGVTLQLGTGAGFVEADIVASGLVSGVFVNLLGPGRYIFVGSLTPLVVRVTGATATDDLFVAGQGEELIRQ